MIDGSECGIASHLQLIFGSLHYGETSGKFPKPLPKFCLPVMGPSRGKEAIARVTREMLIFGSLHYGETSGKFPKPLAKFCLPVMGPSRGKEALQDLFEKWYCNACLFCG
ncbi:hypothetical protein CDAR_187341 [Caerostris darwini]|uniref:Uncharacterized protein n=1 Tax=Caerostris darwini TaxID=1538125 RepID=A0AAV4SXN6_9ARAC|nr:hypothetical protein CDAR_187341 [Caerostris darwini]